MGLSARTTAPLLFGSGFCALVYQITWTREFRLIFGASTAASAAVLAIFIGGLGAGGLWLGRKADQSPRPLALYARLEALVAVMTAVTPALFWLIRRLYVALGGTVTLGIAGGTALRLVLAALVLAGPTVAMGGTLPAAVRSVASSRDQGRRGAALLYGVNTLGAVTGSFVSTFLLLEVFGARITLWMACLVNLLVAVMALRVDRDADDEPAEATEAAAEAAEATQQAAAPAPFVLASAAIVGFAFFLMELVWYRMLGPILGGTVFTFGLILTMALLGIGLGGAAYASRDERKAPDLLDFAYTCLLEALLTALPFALGDRVAALAQTLRGLGWLGFWGQVLGWSLVAGVVVVPAALVSGYQFPMLIALLGRGRQEVGRQVGLTYAWNTVGAIVGSLAGGFGLLPLLGAPGCWRFVALSLAALGAVALGLSLRGGLGLARAAGPAAILAAALGLQAAGGPSAFWRHGSIGAGRSVPVGSPSDFERARRDIQRDVVWERDGVESSVAIRKGQGDSFYVNGKSDGNAISDAGTQVMAGLVGAALRPGAARGLVIGLGTGSTAGWLAAAPGMQQVDVVEIEPAIVQVARDCAPVNQRVLDQPRVKLLFADAREVLLATPQRYDIIFSEPSNPYRAGIASLFTQEFYRAAQARLAPRGLFLQWVQAYEVSPQTVRTIYATLRSVFPVVDTWLLDQSDLLLVASAEPTPIDPEATRALLAAEPFRSAMAVAWYGAGLEALLAHHLADPSLADLIGKQEGDNLNTDDLSPVEFGFARTPGQQNLFSEAQLEGVARARNVHRALVTRPEAVDWSMVELERAQRQYFIADALPALDSSHQGALRQRISLLRHYARGNHQRVRDLWTAQPPGPSPLGEQVAVADSLARLGNDQALPLIDRLEPYLPLEALVLRAQLKMQQQHLDDALALLTEFAQRHHDNPWIFPRLAQRALQLIDQLGAHPGAAARLLPALQRPFAAHAQDDSRQQIVLSLSLRLPDPRACVDALRPFEPHAPWDERFLRLRLGCYEAAQSPLAPAARADLLRFVQQSDPPFAAGLEPRNPQPAAP